MSFDIAKLDTRARAEAGVEMPIRNPSTGAVVTDDDGKAVTITFGGRNSDKYRAVQRDVKKYRTDLAAKNIQPTEAEGRREMEKVVTAMTLGWSGLELDGEPFPFTPANAERLWADTRWTWLLEQAFVFVSQEGNFLALSAAA
jgi:hypothetical protein